MVTELLMLRTTDSDKH